MITKWKLMNFKSVSNLTELSFGPLTILSGANSSGKSTILQSILLISQTLASRVSSRSVVLNGPIVKLGQFDDLKSFGSNADQILIGWEITQPDYSKTTGEQHSRKGYSSLFDNEIKFFSCELKFDTCPQGTEDYTYQLQPRLFSNKFQWVECIDKKEISNEINLQRVSKKTEKLQKLDFETEDENLLGALDYDVSMNINPRNAIEFSFPSNEPVGMLLRHFLPSRTLYRYNKTERLARFIASSICKRDEDSGPAERFFLLREEPEYINSNISPEVITYLQQQVNEETKNFFDQFVSSGIKLKELMDIISKTDKITKSEITKKITKSKQVKENIINIICASEVNEYDVAFERWSSYIDAPRIMEEILSSSLKYLGPLRDEPRPLYPLAPGNDPYDIGIKGEHTAAILDLHKNKKINYINPDSFNNSSVDPTICKQSLKAAIMEWLKYLDVADDVHTQDRGKIGHELKVITKDSLKEQDLTHVGVGVSQVLPILVMCLLADEDTTIIIEQPELHLHPKVQSRLADFFLSMALLRKQCIIETHSEYIINRLRFRAAAADEDNISSLLKIYFAEKKGGSSNFRQVEVNKYGAILDWPEGFFDQSQSEAEEILRSATSKRKAERDNYNA